MQLANEGSENGVANYLAVGTIYNYGEEVMMRGRLLVCEVIEVVAEEGAPQTKHRLKTLLDREEKVCSHASHILNVNVMLGSRHCCGVHA